MFRYWWVLVAVVLRLAALLLAFGVVVSSVSWLREIRFYWSNGWNFSLQAPEPGIVQHFAPASWGHFGRIAVDWPMTIVSLGIFAFVSRRGAKLALAAKPGEFPPREQIMLSVFAVLIAGIFVLAAYSRLTG